MVERKAENKDNVTAIRFFSLLYNNFHKVEGEKSKKSTKTGEWGREKERGWRK